MSERKPESQQAVPDLELEVVAGEKKSFKELLPAIPQVGEDADFERLPDRGRKVRP